MKMFFKVILYGIASTMLFVLLIILIGVLFVPELGVHITYPIRLLRGTEIYQGETRGQEVVLIWERFILPFVFFTSMTIAFIRMKFTRNKSRK